MGRRARITAGFACVALTALVAGCGQQGHAVPGELDVRKLDTGTYPVNRYTYDKNSGGKGALLEGMRMADAVVPTLKVDSSLNVGRDGQVLTSVDDVVSVSRLSSSARPILQNRGFIVGFAAGGSDREDINGDPDPNGTTVTLRLLRFPSADNAKLAAKELEDADFSVALNQNQKLTLPDYPDAFSHWRPGVPTIGVTMPRGQFVISVFASRPSADQTDLLSWAKKSLDAEVPAVDAFQPTPSDKLDQLPVDPDRMLARTLVADRDNRSPDPDKFAVYGPNFLIMLDDNMALRSRLVSDTGMDELSEADDSFLFRVRDAKGGLDLVAGLIASLGETSGNGPDGVPDTKCVHHPTGSEPYRCYVVYKRYVGVVNSATEGDAQKRATAQYALLANSL
ncbi:hypothetical protein [Nocardia sp. NPDC020380]|uniref:DUF7373 family lipoprotein n=1 Tax=Nocardia sp. NPDC020380 TaxID=3364309 RepID=UPI003787A8AC